MHRCTDEKQCFLKAICASVAINFFKYYLCICGYVSKNHHF